MTICLQDTMSQKKDGRQSLVHTIDIVIAIKTYNHIVINIVSKA